MTPFETEMCDRDVFISADEGNLTENPSVQIGVDDNFEADILKTYLEMIYFLICF
jgi:hypothetical protein